MVYAMGPVNAEARFIDGADLVTMNIEIYLRPPAEFRSGTYHKR
jgi:hypothetical protein